MVTCDIWDTDYNCDNWKTEFITIYVTWQLRVTLDSIRNSCDVFLSNQLFLWISLWSESYFGCVSAQFLYLFFGRSFFVSNQTKLWILFWLCFMFQLPRQLGHTSSLLLFETWGIRWRLLFNWCHNCNSYFVVIFCYCFGGACLFIGIPFSQIG